MENAHALENLHELIRTPFNRCIQCGRCSANCPAGSEMDALPNRMVWYLANDNLDALLEANSPWKCMSCFSCEARCPRGISPAEIMEAVRLTHIRQQGKSQLTPEQVAGFEAELPQQALVAAFRKFTK